MTGSAVAQNYDYLDDANVQSDAPVVRGGFPKVMQSETQSDAGTPQSWSKYDLIGAKSGMVSKVAQAQAINPDLEFHYSFHPRAYLGYRSKDPCDIAFGMPFNQTGPATTGCSVYAGHWLYQAGTRLAQSVDSSSRTIRVADANRLSVGSYVVIYDSPAGSFRNAEHVLVTGIDKNVTPHRVTLGPRGFKSTPRAHGVNSIVAVHERGSAGAPENWAYNISTAGPRDSNNRTIGQVMAAWIPQNMRRNVRGQVTNVNVTGIYFDEDGYVLFAQRVDANNDLQVDNGILNDGTNVWGEGLEQFYAQVRARVPGLRVVGGWRQSRGFGQLNGTQMENWLLAGNEFDPNPDYTGRGGVYSQLHNYTIHSNFHTPNDGYMESLSKVPTRLYPGTVKTNPTPPATNTNFRFGLGAVLLGNGHYGRQNSDRHPDPWYDEYAVDVTPGSPRYGRAVARNSQDESAIRNHKGWLGRPLGKRQRIYNADTFKASRNRIANGGFESGTSGWVLRNVRTQIDTNTKLKGNRSLRVLGHSNYSSNVGGASVRGPEFDMVQGRTYTFAFAARAQQMREVYVQMDWSDNQGVYLVPERWTRFVFTVTAERSGKFRPIFNLGREETPMWIDDVYVFEGDPNIFRRDFQNGIVVVNATPKAQTVPLGGRFLRIRGTGQDSINNGASLTSVTLPPWDAAILVRPEGGSQPAPAPAPSPDPAPAPSGDDGSGDVSVGGQVWRDLDGDGIQDANEGAYSAGLRVELQNCSGTVLRSATTNANGEYRFNNVTAGRYRIGVQLPNGFTFSPALVGDRGDRDSNISSWPGLTGCMNLTSGSRRLAVDVGLVTVASSSALPSARIGDFVWQDVNGNGIQGAAERGLAGVTVRLTDCEGRVVRSTVSGGQGGYSFTVPPGEYALRFIRPNGYRFSPANRGTSRAADSNINPATGVSGCMSLADGDNRTWFDVGFVPE